MRWRIPSALLLGALFLVSCTRSEAPVRRAVRLGFSSAMDYLPYFVIVDRGMDKEAGIQFQITAMAGGAAVVQAMAAGTLDAGYVGSVPILQAATDGVVGNSVVVVAANTFSDTAHLAAAVLVSPKVKDWKDLEGAYVAVNSPTSLGAWAIVGRFRQEGIRNYTFVNISLQNMGLAVAGGSVRAAVMFEPYITQSLQRGDGKLLGWIIGGPPLTEMPSTALAIRAGFLRDNAAAARSLVSLHVRAVRWILHNEKAARSILGRGLFIDSRVTDAMNLLQWRPDCRNDPALWQGVQATFVSLGFLPRAIPTASLFDESVLEDVLKGAR
jgi:NitT/TauT family transport system substrate-binding protein